MTPFEYLSVLISIVLGLGVTELLSGVQRLARARGRVRYHWLPLTWSGLVFVALVQWWWAAFGLRFQEGWNFFSFLLVLLVPVLFYLAAALVLPAEEPGAEYDLRAHYFGIHRLLFGTIAAASVLETVRAVRVADTQAAVLNLTAAALLASLAWIRAPRYHAVATVGAVLLLLSFIVVETLRIT